MLMLLLTWELNGKKSEKQVSSIKSIPIDARCARKFENETEKKRERERKETHY